MARTDIALSVKNLSKDFSLPIEKKNSVKETILKFSKPKFNKLHALRDINFEIQRGEFFGVVGRNGSGKSTLLKIIGGIYQPTRGSVHVNGSLTPFIELGIGFNPELTGRENVFLNGAILGLTRKETIAKYDEIVAFAELGKFMDQKLKNYSSGMQVRLAFAIAIQAHNDILLIDEVLAVGDAAFQRKCFEIFKDIKQSSKTVIFVSHDMGSVREFCDRALMIEEGNVVSEGEPDKVANDYLQLLSRSNSAEVNQTAGRWGDHQATISDIHMDIRTDVLKLSYKVTAHKGISNPIFGTIIKNLDNVHIFDSNTKWKKVSTSHIEKGNKVKITWEIPNIFKTGRYKVTVAAAHEDGFGFYDWQDDVINFDISKKDDTAGLILLDDRIIVEEIGQ